MGVTSRVSTKS